jgi:hypothetical protein
MQFIDHKADLLFTAGIGEISFHMLKDNLIDIVTLLRFCTAIICRRTRDYRRDRQV